MKGMQHSYASGYKISKVEMGYGSSKKIIVGNSSKILAGKAQDHYDSKYKIPKPNVDHANRSSGGRSVESQINRMTKGTGNQ